MKRLFLSISKGEELRFLGHLDMLRTIASCDSLRDSYCFSEGFNPHMKIAFDAALGVGVTADPLYLEMKLEKDFYPKKFLHYLPRNCPKGSYFMKSKKSALTVGNLLHF